jgi:ABC-2 type transport system ATP-binding protein
MLLGLIRPTSGSGTILGGSLAAPATYLGKVGALIESPGIAAAMLAGPELLILDEPTNGLDPGGIVEMRGLIRSLAGDGITVLVSSHLISEIEQICDHVVMIRAGRLVHQGSVDELRAAQQPEFLLAPNMTRTSVVSPGCSWTPGTR